MALDDWYLGTTKSFSGTISLSGSAPDISGDTVTIRLKSSRDDADASAVLSKDADVATSGASGIYEMTVLPADSASLTAGKYWYDIEWATAGGANYILEIGEVELMPRVSDVP